MHLSIHSAKELITKAQQLGVELKLVNDNQIKISSHKRPPPELIDKLKEYKPFIIQVLSRPLLNITDLPNYGLELLADDHKFLLKRLPFGEQRQEFLSRYIECWLNGMAKEAQPHKQQNAGRRAANSMIREATEPVNN